MFVCLGGHLAIRKARQGKKDDGTNQTDTYYFDVEKCKTCALKNGCYQPGAKTKSYSASIKSKVPKSTFDLKFELRTARKKTGR